MEIVNKVIKCNRTLELIHKSLKAGYIDPDTGKLVKGDIGTPQGSVLSPLLSNIVLHELDKFMEELRNDFNRGTKRRKNLKYVDIISKRRSVKGAKVQKQMLREARKLNSTDLMDPNFRRLKYVRYAYDFIVLITGTKEEAEVIRLKISNLLKAKCGLTLNIENTLITHIQEEGFKFLGASCNKAYKTKNHVVKHSRMKSTKANTRLRVNVDLKKICDKLVTLKFAKRTIKGVPVGTAYNAMLLLSHYEIVNFFNSKIRGIINFYSFAGDRSKL